jgi:hypothetical protein
MQEPCTGCHVPLLHAALGSPVKPALQVPWHGLPLAVPLHCPAGQLPFAMVLPIVPHTACQPTREHGKGGGARRERSRCIHSRNDALQCSSQLPGRRPAASQRRKRPA